MKRSTSLHNNTPEVIVDISDKWKHRAMPYKPHDNESTFKRIFVAASNIERNAEDGCMKKIKIERSLKLRQEDTRGRSTDLITNTNSEENSWLNSFGG